MQLDNAVFDKVHAGDNGGKGVLGEVYVQQLTATANDPEGMAAVLFLNSTSQDVVGSFGAFVHQAFLRKYCDAGANTKCTKDLKLNFIEKPFPLTKQFEAVIKTAAGTSTAILMAIAWLMMSDSLIQNIIRERFRNIKHQIMVSGSSLTAYWLAHYLADILHQSIPSVVGILGIWAFGIDVPDVWVLFIVNILANPAFIYFLSFLFEKEETGSLFTKMVFFVIGIIAPIAIAVLQVINEDTIHVANILRWFFYPFPIFCLTFGYMSISNRDILKLFGDIDPNRTLKPFDMDVAGPSLYFLCGAVVFYWLLVVAFELKIIDTLLCRGSRRVDPEQARASVIDGRDRDVLDEEDRVASMSKDQLPVRMANLSKTYDNVKAVKNVSFGLEYGECFALLGVSGAGKTSCFKCMTGEIYPSQGSLTICGHDVTTSAGFQMARKQIGYCPQFDAIFEGLTVLEHL